MRNKIQTKTIHLRSVDQIQHLFLIVNGLPIDKDNPIQVVIREPLNVRSVEQNKLYWGILESTSEQAWVQGKKHDKEVWNHYFKEKFLPEYHDEECTRKGYQKYSTSLRTNESFLKGSTSDLTVSGMSKFLDEVIKYSAELGVIVDHANY